MATAVVRRRSARGWLGPAVVTGALVPAADMAVRAARGTLGANPISEALNRLGLVALVFLVASLACTPARLLFGWGWAAPLRRTLGLLGFAYAALHLGVYLLLERRGAPEGLLEDIAKRPFITVGALAFALLVPLALTSTARSIKRLGATRWRALHRLAYLAALLGVVHFFMRVKRDVREPLAYGVVLALLLLVRWYDGRSRQ